MSAHLDRDTRRRIPVCTSSRFPFVKIQIIVRRLSRSRVRPEAFVCRKFDKVEFYCREIFIVIVHLISSRGIGYDTLSSIWRIFGESTHASGESRLGSRERHDCVRRTLLVIQTYVITLVLLVIDALTRRVVRETDDLRDAKLSDATRRVAIWRGSAFSRANRDERREKGDKRHVGCTLK